MPPVKVEPYVPSDLSWDLLIGRMTEMVVPSWEVDVSLSLIMTLNNTSDDHELTPVPSCFSECRRPSLDSRVWHPFPCQYLQIAIRCSCMLGRKGDDAHEGSRSHPQAWLEWR